jgi:hypothetical protein
MAMYSIVSKILLIVEVQFNSISKITYLSW